MTVTLPLVVLVGVAVFFLWRYSPVGPVAITVIALFGFLLSATPLAPSIWAAIHGTGNAVSSVSGKAGPVPAPPPARKRPAPPKAG